MKRTPEQTARARELRRNQTNAERAMWARLRNRQAEGAKFKRQWPIGPFIVTTQPSPFQGRGNLVAVDYQMWHHHHLPCGEGAFLRANTSIMQFGLDASQEYLISITLDSTIPPRAGIENGY